MAMPALAPVERPVLDVLVPGVPVLDEVCPASFGRVAVAEPLTTVLCVVATSWVAEAWSVVEREAAAACDSEAARD
jgi:hypothetical protein